MFSTYQLYDAEPFQVTALLGGKIFSVNIYIFLHRSIFYGNKPFTRRLRDIRTAVCHPFWG